jgi:hypothetical protein
MTCYKCRSENAEIESAYSSPESPVCAELMERIERLLIGQKSLVRRVCGPPSSVRFLLVQLKLLITGETTD